MDPKDMFQFWEKATKNYQDAFSQWQNMLPGNMQNPDFNQLFAPWQPIVNAMQSWCQQMGEMSLKNISEHYEKEMHKKAFGVLQDQDKKSFDFLHQMVTQNFTDSYQKLVESSGKMFTEASQKDPKMIMQIWQTMITEYLKDLDAIPENAKNINMQQFMEILNKVTSQEKKDEKYSQRLLDSLKVKLTYGLEYYADPEQTKVGLTPKDVVWEQGKFKLYHYKTPNPQKNSTPLLIVYSLINRPYILDLLPGISLIEYFTKKGLDVYLIDWGEPDYEDRHMTLDAIISPGISQIVDFICKESGCEKISLFGHCLGGVLSLLYTACYPEKVDRLLTLTTPITGSEGGIVNIWANLMPVDQIVDTFGNMPAKLIRYTFIALKPYYEVIRWKHYYERLEAMSDEAIVAFNAVDKWVNDNIDVPGEAYRKFMHEMYQEDRFSKNQTKINGKTINLGNITCPLFNILAEDDWIVTPKSASILNELVGSKEKQLRVIPGQHLSILLDPRNRKVWGEMAQFFTNTSEEKKSSQEKTSSEETKDTSQKKNKRRKTEKKERNNENAG